MDFNLTEKLYEIKEKGKYPMHMPGHKRTSKMSEFGNELGLPYEFDITEIDGYDNLHAPDGILWELGNNAAKMYGAKYAYPLVNGSTAGIISAIGACARNKGAIISRACHKSVYSAIEMFSIQPVYIQSTICEGLGICGSITAADVEEAFAKSPDASVVVLTSPTYEGVISNIREIAEITHSHGAFLVLDCAHGAHLGFAENEYLPKSYIEYADIAIVSLHKTLPALTQCALCLNFSNEAERLDEKIRHYLSIFMTSSPSYILLSSIDKCLSIINDHGHELFFEYAKMLSAFEARIAFLKNLSVLGYSNMPVPPSCHAFDKGKINVFCSNLVDFAGNMITAQVLAKFLRLNGFEPEMISRDYLILMTSIMDDPEELLKLADLLCHFDMWCKREEAHTPCLTYPVPSIKMTLADAVRCESERLELEACEGRISLDYVMCYPPGIPIVCPGEEITHDVLSYIAACRKANVNVIGADIIRVKKQEL